MFKNKVCEVVSHRELLWFGKPPNVTQLEDSDEAIAAAVRERQADAYACLESLVQQMETILQQIASWGNISGFGPADRQISLARLRELKDAAAKHIEVEVEQIIKTYDDHATAVLQEVKVLIATTDAANKLFANILVGPAKSLRNRCQVALAILDEGQRCELLPAAALFSHVQTAIVISDANQRIEPDKTYATRNPWARDGRWGTIRNPDPQWVTDVLLDSASTVQRAQLTL